MGKQVFSPQGVRTPVFILQGRTQGLKPLRFLETLSQRWKRCATQRQTGLFRSISQGILLSEEEVGGYEEGEDYGDDSVHGEEGGVEAREVVGLDQGMFVEQK